MGYSTEFEGQFNLDRKLDEATHKFLEALATTRRMKRDPSKLPKNGFEKYGFTGWGIDGEFYVDGEGDFGQAREASILDYNDPPRTQPSLWCQWVPTYNGEGFEWDGGEKFYDYVEWLEYIIAKVLEPRGYTLNGTVDYQGEEHSDFGQIKVENNRVYTRVGQRGYGEWE